MTLITVLTCWHFVLEEWRTVALYQNEQGYGVVRDYLTAKRYTLGFYRVEGETVCYIPKKD